MIPLKNVPPTLWKFEKYLPMIQNPYAHLRQRERLPTIVNPPLQFNVNRATYKIDSIGNKCTLLMHAVCNNDEAFLNALLELPGVHINKRNSYGYTALHAAILSNRLPMVTRLLKCPDIDVNRGTKSLSQSSVANATINTFPLLTAVKTGNTQMVLALLNMPTMDINQKNDAGESAYYAAPSGDISILLRSYDNLIRKTIIIHQRDKYTTDTCGRVFSSRNDAVEIFDDEDDKSMLIHGLELMCAIGTNDKETVYQLLKEPFIDVNFMYTESLSTALLLGECSHLVRKTKDACWYKYPILEETIRHFCCKPPLLETLHKYDRRPPCDYGPCPDNSSYGFYHGDNPLWIAIMSKQVDIVRMLVQHPRIDVNYLHMETGKTALTHAIETGMPELVSLLTNHPSIDLFPREFTKEWQSWHEILLNCAFTTVYPSYESKEDDTEINTILHSAYETRGLKDKRDAFYSRRSH